jgi:hypothetical protein
VLLALITIGIQNPAFGCCNPDVGSYGAVESWAGGRRVAPKFWIQPVKDKWEY